MRVAFFGTPALSARYLSALAQHHQVTGVVTQPDRPSGRHKTPVPSPVKEQALEIGAQVLQPQSGQCSGACKTLEQGSPETCVVVAFGQKLPCGLRDCAVGRCINVHYSLLPKLRGAAPVQHALLQGLERTGVTIQHIAPGWDEGDVILQRELDILPEDTCGTLTDRLTDLGIDALLEALALIAEGTAPRVPQDNTQATFAPSVKKSDGLIDWNLPAETLERAVRAYNPWPTAHTMLAGKGLRVLRAHLDTDAIAEGGEGEVGMLVEVSAEAAAVTCGQGRLWLDEVQLEGRKRMTATEFLRGARLTVGARLG